MDWEVEDFRPKPPPPKWLEWTPSLPGRYIMGLIFYLFLLPWIIGFSFTPPALFFNLIVIDYLFYKADIRRWYG